jgi:hypothetical protein
LGKEGFLSSKTVQTDSGVHQTYYAVVTGVLSRGQSSQGVKLTIHLHLALKLNNEWNRTFTLTICYAFMAWATTVLHFNIIFTSRRGGINDVLHSYFPSQCLNSSFKYATCSVYLIFHDFVALVMSGEE